MSESDALEMKACPYCGHERLKLLVNEEEWNAARVSCQAHKCGALGPWVELEDFPTVEEAKIEAVRLWNTRLSSPPPAVGGEVERAGAIAASEGVADRNLRHLRVAIERRAGAKASTLENLRYLVNNPSAWTNYDEGVSELIRAALTPQGGQKP
jgi:hypothetical protein